METQAVLGAGRLFHFRIYPFLGAALATWTMDLLGVSLPAGKASYLPSGALLSYWVSLSGTGFLISTAASIAGALLIVTNRTVLTAGVVIALALVPAGTVIGMAAAIGDWSLLSRALGRWSMDVVLVLLLSGAVFVWKSVRIYRRKADL